MATKLYVGRLAYSTTDDDLQTLFGQYGTVVSAQVIKDRDSGQSKGFAFVELDSDDAAKAAVAAMDGKEFGGRTIVVNEARPQENRPRTNDGGSRGGFQKRY